MNAFTRWLAQFSAARMKASAPADRAAPPLANIIGGLGFNGLPPLSHGYVHEPFAGAWQQNRECFGPNGVFSAVYACIATIAGDIAKLPPLVRQTQPDGTAVDHPNHPAQAVLLQPNGYQTSVDFWGQFMACALLAGNVYVLLERDQRNVISGMHLLDPRQVRPMIAPDGSIWYRCTQERVIDAIGREFLPARDVMHHRLLCVASPLCGVTPIYAAGISAMTGQVIQQNSFSFFSNMSRVSGTLTTPDNMQPEVRTRFKTEWEQNFKAGSMGSVAVLSGGLKWEPLTMTAEDAQLIEQLRWNVEDVARCFRVPLYMISDASKISFKNSEQLARNYYTQTLQYHLESIEARLAMTFDLPRNTYIEFDLDSLLRMELDVRMTAYQVGIQSGVLTINEARRKEGLAPKANGDEPLVQMQYIPLSMVGRQNTANTVPASSAGADPAADDPSADDPSADDTSVDDLESADEELSAELLETRVQAWLAGEMA